MYSLPFSSQTRPALPSRITTSAGEIAEGAARQHALRRLDDVVLDRVRRCSALRGDAHPASGNRVPYPPPAGGAVRRRYSADHAHPEHLSVARLDIVFAHEIEAAVVADAEHRQAGRARSLPSRSGKPGDVRGHQEAPARVDMEIAAVDAARVDVLDRVGSPLSGSTANTARLFSPPTKHRPPSSVGRRGAVGDIGKAAARDAP